MGWVRSAGDGMVASPRPGSVLAAIRRAVRPVPGESCGLAFSQLSGDQFAIWGWRIPFALSIILVGVGLWIRLGILETPVFQALLNDKKIEKTPIIEVIRKQPKQIILSALFLWRPGARRDRGSCRSQ
jgi:MFS family permease